MSLEECPPFPPRPQRPREKSKPVAGVVEFPDDKRQESDGTFKIQGLTQKLRNMKPRDTLGIRKELWYNNMREMKDKNLKTIKEIILSFLPDSRILLFGSRSRDDAQTLSDYDVLIVVSSAPTLHEKRQYESHIRKALACRSIDIDVLIKTEAELPAQRHRVDSVVREALETGVAV